MADNDSRAGHGYATREIHDYVNRVHAPHDEALRFAFEAPERFGMPAIQVGPSEGKLLTILVRLAGVRRAVEIGTLAGYSAIRIAEALPADGHLISLEYEPKHAEVARQSLANAGLGGRVTVLQGAAVDLLPTLVARGPFDAVFLDADKKSYDLYGRWAAENLRGGGLLLADNVFLFGRLLQDSDESAAMRRFHEEAPRAFDTVCIPTPDGLLLGIRR